MTLNIYCQSPVCLLCADDQKMLHSLDFYFHFSYLHVLISSCECVCVFKLCVPFFGTIQPGQYHIISVVY